MAEEYVRKDYFEQVIERQQDEHHRIHRRLEELEEAVKKQSDMSLALERITINLDHVLNQLESQSQRIKKLEEVPMETNKKVRDSLITTITGGIIGAVLAKVLSLL